MGEPWFLKEEPIEGPVPPERRKLYWDYLMYQIHRGVRTKGEKAPKPVMTTPTKMQGECLRVISEHEPVSSANLRELLGKHPDQIKHLLIELKRKGYVLMVAGRQGDKRTKWGLTEEGQDYVRG